MSLSFNEFQRELTKRNIDPQVAYVLTLVYERLAEVSQIVNEMANMTEQFADTVAKVVIMSQSDQETLAKVAKRLGMAGRTPGVDVQSVANDPTEE